MNESEEINVPKGTVLFRQGDPSDAMFVVAAGRVRLTLGSGAEVQEIDVLGPGDFFGEISLLTGESRSATAEVIEDSRLLVVGRDAFNMLVQDDLDTVTRMLSEQGARLSRTNDPLQHGSQRLVRVRVIARGLREVGAMMRIPVCIPIDALALVLNVPSDGLSALVEELIASGAGTYEAGTWTIATHEHVDALIAALVVHAG